LDTLVLRGYFFGWVGKQKGNMARTRPVWVELLLMISILGIWSNPAEYGKSRKGGIQWVAAYTCECDPVPVLGEQCLYYDYYGSIPDVTYNCKTRTCGVSYVCRVGGIRTCGLQDLGQVPFYRVTLVPPYASRQRQCVKTLTPMTKLIPQPAGPTFGPTSDVIVTSHNNAATKSCSYNCRTILSGHDCNEASMRTMKSGLINLLTAFSSPFAPSDPHAYFQCELNTFIAPYSNPTYRIVTSSTPFSCSATKVYSSSVRDYYYNLFNSASLADLCLRPVQAYSYNFCVCAPAAVQRRQSAFHGDAMDSQAVPDFSGKVQAITYEDALGNLVRSKVRNSLVNLTTSENRNGKSSSEMQPTNAHHSMASFSGTCETFPSPDGRFGQTCCSLETHTGDNWACLPSMILLGAQKAGTTALFAHLLEHPEFRTGESVQGANFERVLAKELHFFDSDAEWTAGPHQYLSGFPTATKEQISNFINADLSPSYMVKWETLKSIQDLLPQARLVVVLRDPVKRAWSELKMKIRQDIAAFEWRRLISRHISNIKLCLDAMNGYPNAKLIKEQLTQCVPNALSSNERWTRFLHSTVHKAIHAANPIKLAGRNRVNVSAVVEHLFMTSDNGTVAIAGFGMLNGHVKLAGYDSEFLDENVVLYKMMDEIKQIEACLQAGDETLKKCFTDAHWPSSDLSRAHVLRGMYYHQLQNIYELFPRDQVLIIETEELRTNPVEVMKQVTKHVGLNTFKFELADSSTLSNRIDQYMPGFASMSGWRMNSLQSEEPSSEQKHMPDYLQDLLTKYYSPYNEKLFALLNKRFDHWLH